MRVLVSGSTGLVGSALLPELRAAQYEPTRLLRPDSRAAPEATGVRWDPTAAQVDASVLAGHQAVVHLAGESINGRWSEDKKRRIRRSRVEGTRLLCQALASLDHPPEVLVSASAIGYYGDRGTTALSEESEPGQGFLAELCQQWEAATEALAKVGTRVVLLRLGMVLSPQGGALAEMLRPFRLGVGGKLGSGRQYWSWVAIDDVVGAIKHALYTRSLQGQVNCVSPGVVTNAEFTRVLARVLGRPGFATLPAFMVKLVFGEMGEQLMLASQNVRPARLQASGFTFREPQLAGALRRLLS